MFSLYDWKSNLKKAYLLLTLNSSLLSIIHHSFTNKHLHDALTPSLIHSFWTFSMITISFFFFLWFIILTFLWKIILKSFALFLYLLQLVHFHLYNFFLSLKTFCFSNKKSDCEWNRNLNKIKNNNIFFFFFLVFSWLFQFKYCNNSIMCSNHY